jgi:hypothetical protein
MDAALEIYLRAGGSCTAVNCRFYKLQKKVT